VGYLDSGEQIWRTDLSPKALMFDIEQTVLTMTKQAALAKTREWNATESSAGFLNAISSFFRGRQISRSCCDARGRVGVIETKGAP